MNEMLSAMFGQIAFMPHGHCYFWTPSLVWLHVISDALIVVAYYSIPVSLVLFVRGRKDLKFGWMFVCFAAFIVACGTTHLMEIWNVWHANYWLSGSIKAVTAAASVPTAILLARLVPVALTLASPEQLRQINEALKEEILTRRKAEEQARHLNTDLERRVVERTAELKTANRELTRQISERQHADEALRANEADFRASFYSKAVGQAQFDSISGRYLRVNPQFCEIAGYAEEELLQMTVMDLTHPDDREFDRSALATMLEENEPTLNLEKRYVRKDGATVWVRVDASTIRDESGRPLRTLAVVQDITERRQSEEKATWLASFPERNPSPIAELGLEDGIVHYVNPFAAELFPDLKTKGLNHPWLSGLRDELKSLRNGSREGFRPEVCVDGRHYSQTLKYLPEVRRLRVYASDITTRWQAEEAVRELNNELEARVAERTAQLESANQELEAFSYSVSHDLRAPLRTVDGFSHALIEDYGAQLPEGGQRYVETIRKGARRMGILIDDLLTFSRLSRAPLSRRKVDTMQLVRDALDELKSQWEGRQVDMRLADLPACDGDIALLKQVWINLLSNAIKYTQKCDAAVIEIGCRPDPGRDIFFVRDNGTGFDMKYVAKLFGVFQRLHRADEYEGTGVGLAIVHRIVTRHGGRIWVEAQLDLGATFFFTLEGGTLT